MNNENKTNINWVSRIYEKPSIITCKIRKSSKKVFTHFDDFILKGA